MSKGHELAGKPNLCSQCGAPTLGARCGHCGVGCFSLDTAPVSKEEYYPSRNRLLDQTILTALMEAAEKYGIRIDCSIEQGGNHTSTLTVMVEDDRGETVRTGSIHGYGTGGVDHANLKYVCRYYHPLQWGTYGAEINELWLSWAAGAFDSAGETVFSTRKTGYSSGQDANKTFIGAGKLLDSKVIKQMILCLIYPAVDNNEGLRKRLAREIIGLR